MWFVVKGLWVWVGEEGRRRGEKVGGLRFRWKKICFEAQGLSADGDAKWEGATLVELGCPGLACPGV